MKIKEIQDEEVSSTILAGVKDVRPVIECKMNDKNIVFIPKIEVLVSTTKKGIHMSRLLESVLLGFFETEKCDYIENLGINLVKYIKKRAESIGLSEDKYIHVKAEGDYIYDVLEPCLVGIDCCSMPNGYVHNDISVTVTCINACPCALNESENKLTHTQNVDVTVQLSNGKVIELIRLIEENVTPTRSLLKRGDEIETIKNACEEPMFSEDIVRKLEKVLEKKFSNGVWQVNVVSHESIHKHKAIAGTYWG